MGPLAREISGVLTLIAAAMVAPVPLFAQISNDRESCFKGGLPPDHSIAACAAFIQSGLAKPEDLDGAFINRGTAYRNKRDYDRAIADYTEAIKLNPGTEAINLKLGHYLQFWGDAYLYKHDYDRAIADYDCALRLMSNDTGALYGRGMVKLKKGDIDGGNADVAAARAIRPVVAAEQARNGVR